MNDDVSTSGKIPVEQLRGIDPLLFDERGNHSTVLIHAPCDAVAVALSKRQEMKPNIEDLLEGPVTIPHADLEHAIFVFQFRGHAWTQIEGRDHYLFGLAEELSRALGTPAFQYIFQDVTGGIGYSLYNKGELLEEFSDVDNSSFGDDVVEEYRQEAFSRGCRVSSSGRASFLTKRGTLLNLESPEECQQLMGKVATELDMFVAADVFATDKSGTVECMRRWSMRNLQAAKLLRALSEKEQRRRRIALETADENAKLRLS